MGPLLRNWTRQRLRHLAKLELHQWIVLVAAGTGMVLGLLGYVRSKAVERRQCKIEVEGLLDEAWTLLGGSYGFSVVEGERAIRVPEFERLSPEYKIQLASAGELIRRAEIQVPNHPRTARVRGVYLAQGGQIDAARDTFALAMKLSPGDHRAVVNLGNAYLQLKEPQLAVDHYQKALELRRSPRAYLGLSAAYQELRRPDDALAAAETALELDPTFADAHANRCSILEELGRLTEGIEACRTAILFDPQFARAHHNLGWLLQVQGDLHGAREAFEAARGLSPQQALTLADLAQVLADLGEEASARELFAEARRIWPGLADILFEHGRKYLGNGRETAAALAFRVALGLEPTHDKAREALLELETNP